MTDQKFNEIYLGKVKELGLEAKESSILKELGNTPPVRGHWLRRYQDLLLDDRPFASFRYGLKDKFPDLVRLVGEQFPLFPVTGSPGDGTALAGYSSSMLAGFGSGEIQFSYHSLAQLVPALRDDALRIANRHLNPEPEGRNDPHRGGRSYGGPAL